ncbi:MAG TPA: choice-of-anchor X domain-containing protein [Candidatus Dormibacteraeota bacterium]|nr:choice-of-anchor X domain-containing protein [Candidatus Dormibacteraeota bacterium]
MTMRRLAAAMLPMLSILSLEGCGSNGTVKPVATQLDANQTAIQNLISNAPEFALSFDDEGELSGDATTAVSTTSGAQSAQTDSMAVLPVRWGRWRIPPHHPPTRTVTFLTPPDSNQALVRVNVKFDGWFFVDLTDDGIRNPGKKPLRDQKTRYALFKKIWFHPDSTSDDSLFGWRLLAVSPVEFTMIDPSKQTVAIHSVTMTGEQSHITITDPATLLSLRKNAAGLLPLFREGETVKVEAAITNTDAGYIPPTFAYLHAPIAEHAFPGPHDWIRILMFDDGTHGDVTAGDGTYTAEWTVGNFRSHHIAVDVLNSRCLQNQTNDDYNSTTWAIPYASYPGFLPGVATH